jgi:polyhydroxyalkanoate synthesis regulator phasin
MPYIGKKPENIIATAIDTTTGDFSGNVTTGGTHTVTGVSILNGGIDVAGDINFDADGADIKLQDGGVEFGRLSSSSNDFVIFAPTQDKDIIFKGDDGGSTVTALTLDMSAAGAASFNSTVTANAGVVVDNITIDGTEIDLSSGDFTLDVAGDIILDAGGQNIKLLDDGTEFGQIYQSSNDLHIFSSISDADLKLQGNDGGSTITALSFDMSDAGNATFNADCKASRIVGNAIIESSSGFSSDVFTGMFLNTSNASNKHGIVCASKHADSNALLVGQHDTSFQSFVVKGGGDIFIASTSFSSGNKGKHFEINTNAVSLRSGSALTTTQFHEEFHNPNGTVGSISTNGSGTNFNETSDYRLKENIVTEWDATTRLKQLKPSRFNFKTDKDTTVDGFIAHEVSSIVPEAVTGEKDGTRDLGTIKDEEGNIVKENVLESAKGDDETWTKTATENVYQFIDKGKLIPLLTKALQEQQATIEALTARIVTLENA